MPSGKDCWKASTDGYNYKERERTPNGRFNLKLKAGTSGKAKITAKAGKGNLALSQDGSHGGSPSNRVGSLAKRGNARALVRLCS